MLGRFSPPPRVSDSDIHHGTCVTHVAWCMPGSPLKSATGKTFAAFPAHAPPASLRIWLEAHGHRDANVSGRWKCQIHRYRYLLPRWYLEIRRRDHPIRFDTIGDSSQTGIRHIYSMARQWITKISLVHLRFVLNNKNNIGLRRWNTINETMPPRYAYRQ